jgi:hypothetical protein
LRSEGGIGYLQPRHKSYAFLLSREQELFEQEAVVASRDAALPAAAAVGGSVHRIAQALCCG